MINFEDTLPASNTKGYFTKVSIGVKVVVLAGELFFLGSHGKLRTKRIKALYQPPKLSLFFTPNSAMKKKNGFAEQTKSLRSHKLSPSHWIFPSQRENSNLSNLIYLHRRRYISYWIYNDRVTLEVEVATEWDAFGVYVSDR
jgi:hypothetical protein